MVEEVSSGGEDPNVSADPGSVVVRARPILATMQSSSSDGQDTVVIAESTLQGNVSLYPGFAGFVPSGRPAVFPGCLHKPW